MKNRCFSGGQRVLYSGNVIFSVPRFLVSVYINITPQLSSHSISSGNEECSACKTGCLYQTAAGMKVRLGYLSNHKEYRGVWLQGDRMNTNTYWNIHQYEAQGSSYVNYSHVMLLFFPWNSRETLRCLWNIRCVFQTPMHSCVPRLQQVRPLEFSLPLSITHVKFAFHDI